MARKPDDWMPLHIGKYMAKTFGLTRDQHGAYLLLLMAYWTNGGPLDADDAALAACAKATPAEWRKLRPVMAKFFTEEGGKWVQSKADKEWSKAVALTEAKAAAGSAGGASKWNLPPDRSREHTQTRSQRLAAAREKGTHTPEEWDAMVGIFAGHCVRCGSLPAKVFKDHIVPIYRGGGDGIENLQPLCPSCNSAKGPEDTDHRQRALPDWRERLAKCLAKCLADAKQKPTPLPQPRTKTEGLSFVVGRGAASRPALDPVERLNRFQKTIAEALGPAGYSIVAAASDPESPLYERSLALCKAKAAELGKGWPHHWPAPEAA